MPDIKIFLVLNFHLCKSHFHIHQLGLDNFPFSFHHFDYLHDHLIHDLIDPRHPLPHNIPHIDHNLIPLKLLLIPTDSLPKYLHKLLNRLDILQMVGMVFPDTIRTK